MSAETRKLRGRPVSHKEACISAQRLINSHFRNEDRARIQIPASPWDDDLMIVDYIEEQSESHKAIYCADVEEIPYLGLKGHEIVHEVTSETVVSMWSKLRERCITAESRLAVMGDASTQ